MQLSITDQRNKTSPCLMRIKVLCSSTSSKDLKIFSFFTRFVSNSVKSASLSCQHFLPFSMKITAKVTVDVNDIFVDVSVTAATIISTFATCGSSYRNVYENFGYIFILSPKINAETNPSKISCIWEGCLPCRFLFHKTFEKMWHYSLHLLILQIRVIKIEKF